jgi:hypothetical protein
MKRVTKILLTAGAALSLGLAAAAVSAHPYGYGPGWGGGHMGGYGPGYGMGTGMMGGHGPGYGMGPGMMGGHGPGHGMGPGVGMHAWGNVDESLAALKAELGITAKQDSAWKAYADNAKKHQETRQAWFAKMQEARSKGSAPELLAQHTEHMKQRQVEMEADAAALKNLYAALTPEQKVIADQRFGGYGPGWNQGYRGGPRGYAR